MWRRRLMRAGDCSGGYQFTQNKQNFAGVRRGSLRTVISADSSRIRPHRNHSRRKGNFQDTVNSEHELLREIVREKGCDSTPPTATMK